MIYQGTTVFELVICAVVLCLFFVRSWTQPITTVGLPFCYLISLGMIHWLGALIHVLPWDLIRDPYVHTGFRQAFWGVLSFVIGSAVIAPLVLRATHINRNRVLY